MRLPHHYAHLRSDLGDVLRNARKAAGLKQQSLADDLRITREALCRIERGKQSPRPDLLDALMETLDLEWSDVATPGRPACQPRVFQAGWRGDRVVELGRDIKQQRIESRLSQEALGKQFGMSGAQISRLERGQVQTSSVFADHHDDLTLRRCDRRIRVIDPKLKQFLHDKGW